VSEEKVIDNFISITRRTILRDGFEQYLPTIVLPALKDVRVLEGVPADADMKTVVASWALKIAGPTQNFVAAYKAHEGHFFVLARVDGVEHERLCSVSGT
jgi:hypothetical protein